MLRSRDGGDVGVEEEPENCLQVWEMSVFCLQKANRKTHPKGLHYSSASQADKQTKTHRQTQPDSLA